MGVERGEREPLKADGDGDSLLQDKLKSKASMAYNQKKEKKKKKKEKRVFFLPFLGVLYNSRSPPVALMLGGASYKNHGPI
jgi:hypothetical protein